MSYQAVGGKLRLKQPTRPVSSSSASSSSHASAASSSSAGTKRPRDQSVAASSSSSAPAGLAVPAAAPAQEAQRLEGKGVLITSGATVHGTNTQFLSAVNLGDALEVLHPVSRKQEIRVVKMVLSDQSLGINLPFSSDLTSGTPFFVLKLARAADDPKQLLAMAEKQRDDAEKSAFGALAGKGGTEFTYREKKAGVHGGYRTVTTALDSSRSREQLLDMRSKKKSDKFCNM